ncbi:5'-3' exonuclease H3TH domain-containing protein [Anaerobacillus sp. MEB173]|uniref:5'-3' exonuclease n=1 Tax=Anaerobacillus sp. MEB173 TaxID=3383345 RepID=UPI003F8DF4A3
MEPNRLLLIDGFNLLSRGYFATSYGRSEDQLSRNKDGLYTNALRVVFQKLVNLIDSHQPSHMVIAWDVKRNETIRKEMYEGYKGTRGELPEPLIQQYETSKKVFETIGISQLSVPRYEADDVIGALSSRWSNEYNKECLIYSNDRDLLQLLNQDVSQIISINKKGDVIYTLQHFQDDYGISPNQWIDVKALLGDKSDNIPGVAGVGEKAALPLIQQYNTIQGIYDKLEQLDKRFNRYKKKLLEGQEMALLSRELVEIIKDIPEINSADFSAFALSFEKARLKEQCEELEVKVAIR